MTITVKFNRIPGSEDIPLPSYATQHASGMDLSAAVEQNMVIAPGQRCLIPTGFRVEIPAGYEGQVRPRSGLALKWGISMANTPGTIDADYRGELKIILINLGQEPFTVKRGDRIAQLVIAPVVQARVVEAEDLEESARSEGGFGHTGV